ncbi:MAG: HU family DNA-binding protein [Mollicutes bacterium]|nr:MAG: HU family DNA-binding protein [Mollicutes bacterium]
MMKKSDFIDLISKKLDITKKEGENVYSVVFDSMVEAIQKDKIFKVIGMGTFSIVKRASRKGINLQTGKPITIPAKDVLKFKISQKLKEKIANK